MGFIDALKGLSLPGLLVAVTIVVAAYIWITVVKTLRKKHPKQGVDANYTVLEETVDGIPQKPKTVGKYSAYIWEKDSIKYGKIPSPIGKTYFADTSLPHSGICYLVIPDGDGYRKYDPRDEPISDVSPGKLYRAIRVQKKVQNVYTSLTGLWEKINLVLAYCAAAGFFLVALVGIDALAKR